MVINNICCLISKIYYTFPHRSAASDCDRLGRWSVWGHYRSRRHRSRPSNRCSDPKRAKVFNILYQKLQEPALPERSSNACPHPMTCSTAVVATWTSPPDATLTSPIMSSSSTTSSSNLALVIYYSFILDHLKFNTNHELNLHKHFLVNFTTSNSFYLSTTDCPLSSILINHSTQSFPLRFVSFNFNKF